MTKKEILQASADSLEAIASELNQMAATDLLKRIANPVPEEITAFAVIKDAASALKIVETVLRSVRDMVEGMGI